ncbi:hypothetical protein [Altererythrobacter aquiaggeris]|uniref:hypothetical protein n=1 Tax=Aestuarierythrobacter aquiaggeris TaxID=1898396 RepID=UPI00301B5CA9
MRKFLIALAASGLAVAAVSPALADDHMEPKAEVTQRNAKGQATMIRIGDQEYAVCTKDKSDGCINPRSAGLNWGNRELDYWPGKPASQK